MRRRPRARVVPPTLHEVVRVLELEPVTFPSGDSLNFRIEIQRTLRSPRTYRARVWRTELFQMRPTWPDGKRISSDEVLVADNSYTGIVTGRSADAVLAKVLASLAKQLPLVRAAR